MGTKAVKVQWTKGHAKQSHIDKGIPTYEKKVGNDKADANADQGTQLHRPPAGCVVSWAPTLLDSELTELPGATLAVGIYGLGGCRCRFWECRGGIRTGHASGYKKPEVLGGAGLRHSLFEAP